MVAAANSKRRKKRRPSRRRSRPAAAASRAAYVPDRGDVVWVTLNPQAGHEQAGRRPAVVVSPRAYNRKVGLALLCPVTSQRKGYPFEVVTPAGHELDGAILADQVKSLDWRARRAEFFCRLPAREVAEILEKLGTLLRQTS